MNRDEVNNKVSFFGGAVSNVPNYRTFSTCQFVGPEMKVQRIDEHGSVTWTYFLPGKIKIKCARPRPFILSRPR